MIYSPSDPRVIRVLHVKKKAKCSQRSDLPGNKKLHHHIKRHKLFSIHESKLASPASDPWLHSTLHLFMKNSQTSRT
ncbi:hypothetical protein K1719_005794 [Acacia pycnantha]|nr:hypothetical protein K1719_005794 [Acacia pycnantha]